MRATMMKPPIRFAIVVLLLAWVLPALAQTTVFTDTFTEASSNTPLASHSPDVGTSWTEVIDTHGSRVIQVFQGTDSAGANSSTADDRLVYLATPTAACGADCDVQFDIAALPGVSTQPAALIFGYLDTSNYCAVMIYNADPSADVVLVKIVSGTPTDVEFAGTDPVEGDEFRVERRANDITVKKNGSSILTATDAACNGGNGVGIGFGNIRVSTDDMGTAFRVDDFTVVNQTAGGPPGGSGTGGGKKMLRRLGGGLH
jgi:hypothetical protein